MRLANSLQAWLFQLILFFPWKHKLKHRFICFAHVVSPFCFPFLTIWWDMPSIQRGKKELKKKLLSLWNPNMVQLSLFKVYLWLEINKFQKDCVQTFLRSVLPWRKIAILIYDRFAIIASMSSYHSKLIIKYVRKFKKQKLCTLENTEKLYQPNQEKMVIKHSRGFSFTTITVSL